ncbi:hypothetical protein DV701_04125 [Ornithinimicrobium avium]|uniref:Uncharacterized protein n=1 Tax=Ornithinimicrobium avium TaxID=2283195 RepID=A0A345NK65_9MICO|nr:hypothetical protein DV701_04125 [Ornithinimicrobium avium]
MTVIDAAPAGAIAATRDVAAFARTAALLRQILLDDLRCRRRWLRHARRTGMQQPNQAGVSWVLALELWDRGEMPESRRTLPRSLKDRTSRALSGRLISASTLTLFVDAFDLCEEQEQQLYATWEAESAQAGAWPVHGSGVHRSRPPTGEQSLGLTDRGR